MESQLRGQCIVAPCEPGLTEIGCASTLGHPFHIRGHPGIRYISIVSRFEKDIPVSTVVHITSRLMLTPSSPSL